MSLEHPYGIEPWGNFLMKGGPNIRDASLGHLAVLSDALILDLLGLLCPLDLARCALVSKALYCFAGHEDLWKAAVLQDTSLRFKWGGNWKKTYSLSSRPLQQPANDHSDKLAHSADATGLGSDEIACKGCSEALIQPNSKKRSQTAATDVPEQRPENVQDAPLDAAANKRRRPGDKQQKAKGKRGSKQQDTRLSLEVLSAAAARRPWRGAVRVRGFYSDLLYQPWFCATIDVPVEWLEVDNIERVSGLTCDEFRQRCEVPNRPVVITDAMARWPALERWDRQYLTQALGGQDVIVGDSPMPWEEYLAYSDNNCDEMPLYLFDKRFADKAPQLVQDFDVPPYFREDLFGVLGAERPDYRWLIMGPPRSGSSFHIDPNSTSAWNACVRGVKKWILFPPGCVPPGVHPSPDGADVATPVSIMEWFLNFYEATKECKVKPIECLVRQGELIFVPRGWWHLALNLTDTVAITQNFVSSVTLPHVLRFLRPGREDLVSGCAIEQRANLHDRFVAALREQKPDVLEAVERQQAAARAKAEESRKLSSLFKHPQPAQATTAIFTSSQQVQASTTSMPLQETERSTDTASLRQTQGTAATTLPQPQAASSDARTANASSTAFHPSIVQGVGATELTGASQQGSGWLGGSAGQEGSTVTGGTFKFGFSF